MGIRPRLLADFDVPSKAAAVAFPSCENFDGVVSSCFFLLPNSDPRNPFSSFLSDFFLSLSLFFENNPPFFSLLTFSFSVDCLVFKSLEGGGARSILDAGFGSAGATSWRGGCCGDTSFSLAACNCDLTVSGGDGGA